MKSVDGVKLHPKVSAEHRDIAMQAICRGNFKVLRIIFAKNANGQYIHVPSYPHLPGRFHYDSYISETAVIQVLKAAYGHEEDYEMPIPEVVEKAEAMHLAGFLDTCCTPYGNYQLRRDCMGLVSSILNLFTCNSFSGSRFCSGCKGKLVKSNHITNE